MTSPSPARSVRVPILADASVAIESDERAPVLAPVLLALRGMTRRFGTVTALDSVDLDVDDGEILTILGPSGSGKTTLLKLVAGFELPDAGHIELAGRTITTATPASRGIGMVFQNYALFPHMRVAENVAFPLEMRSLGRAEIKERVASALALVSLAGYEARYPRQLSGGQQQRVALARAIVFRPRLLLLDEPFGALDRKLREQMQLEVKRLQRQLGITALFVTHDQEEALILSDRIAVMNQGRIEQIGKPADIYARPVNRFVADFIGESNLFHGRVTGHDGGQLTVALSSDRQMIVQSARSYGAGAEVGLIVRPEAPRWLADGEQAENAFDGEVKETVYLGNALKYAIRLDGGVDLTVRWPFNQNVRSLAVGDRVRVGWSGDAVHVVDWT